MFPIKVQLTYVGPAINYTETQSSTPAATEGENSQQREKITVLRNLAFKTCELRPSTFALTVYGETARDFALEPGTKGQLFLRTDNQSYTSVSLVDKQGQPIRLNRTSIYLDNFIVD